MGGLTKTHDICLPGIRHNDSAESNTRAMSTVERKSLPKMTTVFTTIQPAGGVHAHEAAARRGACPHSQTTLDCPYEDTRCASSRSSLPINLSGSSAFRACKPEIGFPLLACAQSCTGFFLYAACLKLKAGSNLPGNS